MKGMKELERFLPARGPYACILDYFHPSLPIPRTALRRLRRSHPSLALLVVGDFTDREMDLYHLGRMSVDGVIRLGEDLTPRRVLSALDEAFATRLAEVVIQSVAADLPPLAQETIRWTIERAGPDSRVGDLARALAVSPRTLLRELRAMELSSPRTLLLWGRLIHASHLLERRGETVENVAFRLGYATAASLGKALKNHVGFSPTALCQRGGLAWTLGVFRQKGLRRPGEAKKRWTSGRSAKWSSLPRSLQQP